MIVSGPEVSDRPVSGAALTRNEARVDLRGIPDIPGTSFEIFSRIANKHVTVDMIVQNIGRDGKTDISFTVPAGDLDLTLEAVIGAKDALGDFEVTHDHEVSKVSVVGKGMEHQRKLIL